MSTILFFASVACFVAREAKLKWQIAVVFGCFGALIGIATAGALGQLEKPASPKAVPQHCGGTVDKPKPPMKGEPIMYF